MYVGGAIEGAVGEAVGEVVEAFGEAVQETPRLLTRCIPRVLPRLVLGSRPRRISPPHSRMISTDSQEIVISLRNRDPQGKKEFSYLPPPRFDEIVISRIWP